MGAKGLLVAMVAGTALVMAFGARKSEPHRAPPTKAAVYEEPWLTPEAAAQIAGPDGTLGPLFEGLFVGGPAPTPEVRARIAEFARKNHVSIDFEIADGDIAAIRFSVTFGGCCGYEGADVLARKLGRRSTGVCCVCGPDTWLDDWTEVSDDGTHLRGNVHVNRVRVRWEKTAELPELLERADHLIGRDVAKLEKSAGDRWSHVAGDEYLLEEPFPFPASNDFGRPPALGERDDMGFRIGIAADHVATVSMALRYYDSDELKKALRAHYGRPHVDDGTWTWTKSDRVITAGVDGWPDLSIKQR
jgi:hypothetical protein